MAKAPKDAESAYQERMAEQKKLREETQKQMDEAVPTPTQEENDRASMNVAAGKGANVEPAPSGAPETVTRAASTDDQSATYKNRAVEKK